MISARIDLQELDGPWAEAMQRLAEDNVVERLWDGDHTVIQDDPDEAANRLGWLHVVADSERSWPGWALLADEAVDGAGDRAVGELDDVIVLGMGGSSLFPEVLTETLQSGEGFPNLRILDTTQPDAVLRTLESTDPDRTLVIVSSKSGSTVETRSQLELFWARSPIGAGFIAITDPDSALESTAIDRRFRAVVHGDPDIGGRFSALSAFGMVPAAFLGLDGAAILETADEVAELLGPDSPVEQHLGCELGAFMAVAAQQGRDRLTFHIDPRIGALGGWLEQLIAESTGKAGVGVLPVLGDGPDAADPQSRAHVLIGETGIDPTTLDGPWVELPVEQPDDLGAQVFLWEFATTIAGILLGINPFDQPDVESAKAEARSLLGGSGAGSSDDVQETPLATALELLGPDDALIISAFVDPAMLPQLEQARRNLSERTGAVVTLGIGPRFLHSTGQLHKGGSNRHVVVQALQRSDADLAIPGEDFTFGELFVAQADGDLTAVQASGHRAVRVPLADLLDAAAG